MIYFLYKVRNGSEPSTPKEVNKVYDKKNKAKVDSIIPKFLEEELIKSAEENNRSKSQEICYILTRYFAHKTSTETESKRGNSDVHNMEGTKSI